MRLKYIREEKELTQWEVANMLNVSRSVYGMWEQEHDVIPINRLNDFCNIFDVSMDYALGFSNRPKYYGSKKEINKDIIKERIKDLRKKRFLTQEKLSISLDITRSLISKYENGTNLILTNNLIQYMEYFKVSADYIVGRINTPYKVEKVFVDIEKMANY